MKMQGKKQSLGLVFATLSVALAAVFPANAQLKESGLSPRSVYFWNSAAGTQGLKAGVDSARVGVWGNGEQKIARDVEYEGADTLKIVTRGFREGVRFDLKTPLDITPYQADGYVRLRVRFHDSPQQNPAGQGGFGAPGAPGGMMPGEMMPAAPGAPGFGGATIQPNFQMAPLPPLGAIAGGGMGMPGMPGMTVPAGPTPQDTPITQFMVTFVLENGIMEGTIDVPKQWDKPRLIDFDKVRPDANGWLLFTLPLKEMRSTPNASGLLQRVILSGDRQDSFWLTQAALVVETGDMQVSIRRLSDPPGTQTAEITVRPGAITLVADVEAGAADPAIEWNFDADNVGNLPIKAPEGTQPGGQAPGGMTPGGFPGGDPALMPGGMMPGGGMPVEGTIAAPLGPRIDARGLIAKFEYPNEEQNYRVEVTVRDRAGKKEPVTTSILVKVRG
jgi:hypothetical protein